MADSSNTEVDSQVDESTESETTSNSNGNFSGGFDSSALSNESLSTDSTPDFGIDFGSNNNNGSFDFSYNPFDDSGFDFGDALSGDSDSSSGSSKTSETYNESEPVMTVDEVYGKGNQSIVESQGDYAASSNEKSNVETSTLGKQDEISVTPTSVTENKGLVNNNAIQSVEGLDFQQKDKESQDVLEAKKNRDEAEAKDKTSQMKDSLLANIGKPIGKQGEGDVSKFQLGDRNKDLAAAESDLAAKSKALDEANAKANQLQDSYKQSVEDWRDYKEREEAKKQEAEETKEATKELIGTLAELTENPAKTFFNRSEINELKHNMVEDAKNYGLNLDPKGNVQDIAKQYTTAVRAKCDKDIASANSNIENRAKELGDLQEAFKAAKVAQQEAQNKYETAQTTYDNLKNKSFVGEETPVTTKEKAPTVTPESKAAEKPVTPDPKVPVTTTPKAAENTEPDIKQTFDNAIKTAAEKGADEQTIQKMNDVATAIGQKQEEIKDAIERNDIPAYIEAQKQYNDLLEDAMKIGNVFTRTDYNKPFVEAVTKANDFKVTLADGTVKDYSQFATEMVTKSPEIAKAMYEAKADKLEKDGHNILAKIERAKAAMVDTWIGSKLTRADNQVRNQFNQMAKTNMRAVYATYNNVLKDKTGKYSEADKAKASEEIKQANALMTASAALKASTGFWSGISDSVKDGVYGTTDPKTLNAYQKTLNTVDNLAKITLGLGVTPGANKAYQNMYYMAGAKVNESGLFSKDWDGDGFALCQEYGNNATAALIASAGELATGVTLFFNPSTAATGVNLVIDAIKTSINGLYGVQKDARKSQQYTQEVLSYFEEAKDIAEQSGNKEAVDSISDGITQIENFELKPDEVGNLNNWLEGSGSNTADNGKFNQALTYDEWLKLIEADPTMRDYAKKLIAEKKSE